MAGEDDNLDIDVNVTGAEKASHDLNKVADSAEGVGDSAAKSEPKVRDLDDATNDLTVSLEKQAKTVQAHERALQQSKYELAGLRAEVEKTGKAEGELGKQISEVEARIKRQTAAVEKHARVYEGMNVQLLRLESGYTEATKAERAFNNEAAQVDGWLRRLTNRLNILDRDNGSNRGGIFGRIFGFGSGGGGIGGILGKVGGFFKDKAWSTGFFAIKWSAIAFGVSFLGKIVEGLGAAGLAAVNGLAPLTGLLIAYPGYVGSLVQAFGVFKIATAGVMDAITTMSDPNATPEQLEKALRNMSVNQIAFARAVADSKDAAIGLRKSLSDKFFKGLDGVYNRLTKIYFPLANKYLGAEATMMNGLVKSAADYLESTKTQVMLKSIMSDNTYEAKQFGGAMGYAADIILHLVNYAGPMLRRMSRDFNGFMKDLDGSVQGNESGITRFFNKSYDLFKKVKDTTTDYVKGLWNIVDYSDALTSFMGKKLKGIGKDFREFTESDSGEKKIRRWFRDMRPVVKEIGLWVRDLSVAVSKALLDGDDFVTSSRALRKRVLPVITDLFSNLVDHVVPTIEKLHDSGLIGGTARVMIWFGKGIEAIANALNDLPDGGKKLLAYATGLYALKRMLSGEGVVGGALGKTGLLGGVQKVMVVNWPPGMGGFNGSDGVPYGPDGKPKPGEPRTRRPRVSEGTKNAAGVVASILGGAGLDFLSRKLPNSEGKPDPFFHGASRGAVIGGMIGSYSGIPGLGTLGGAALGAAVGGVGGMYMDSGLLGGKSKAPKTQTPSANPFLPPAAAITLPNGGVINNPAFKIWMDNIDENTRKMNRWNKRAEESVHGWVKMGGAAKTASGDLRGVGTVLDKDVSVNAIQAHNKVEQLKKMADEFNHPYQPKVTVLGVDEAKTKVSGVQSALDHLRDRTVDLNINLATTGFDTKALSILGGDILRFAGGDTKAGQKYIAGEFGPEAWINRAGQIKMLGLNGPEMVSPGEGAVIPAGATANPLHGNMGNAPDWAARAYQSAALGHEATLAAARAAQAAGRAADVPAPIVNVKVINPKSEHDIKRAVKQAVKEAMQEASDRA